MVIYIDGPINSGKTTISKLLAKRLANTVHVEIDDLRHFADCLTLDEVIPFALEDAICVTKNWVSRGFNVIVSWPLSPENYRIFSQAMLSAESESTAFTLLPREDVCISNRGHRELESSEVERIRQMYQWRRQTDPVGLVVDNTEQSPDETAEEILSIIAAEGSGSYV